MSPTVDDLKQSKYLAKHDVEPPILVTIDHYSQEDVSMENQPADMKYVLHFEEECKPMVLNQTNGQLIASIAGSADFDDWPGTKIVLYNEETVMFAGKMVGGIRVRAPKNKKTKAKARKVQPQTEEVEEIDDDIPF